MIKKIESINKYIESIWTSSCKLQGDRIKTWQPPFVTLLQFSDVLSTLTMSSWLWWRAEREKGGFEEIIPARCCREQWTRSASGTFISRSFSNWFGFENAKTTTYLNFNDVATSACCREAKIPNQYGGVILWCLFMCRIDPWLQKRNSAMNLWPNFDLKFDPILQWKQGKNKPENPQNWNMAKIAPKSHKFTK